MTPIEASEKANEKEVGQDRQKRKQKFKLGQLVRTADIKRVFIK